MSAPLAYERGGRPIDGALFYGLACDPARSVAVEACAGAGKTWLLVSRIVRALLAGSAPQDILAITFTRKAAGEMRQRLQLWLATFARAEPAQLVQELRWRGMSEAAAAQAAPALRDLYRRLLQHGRPVQIRTFHGWFGALLGAAPLAVLEQLGLPPQHELLEDDSEAVDRVWRRFRAGLLTDPAAEQDYRALIAQHGRFQIHKALEAALARRVEFGLADAQGVVDRSVHGFAHEFAALAAFAEPEAALFAGTGAAAVLAAARALGRADAAGTSARGAALEQAVAAHDAPAVIDGLLTQRLEPRKFSDRLAGIDAVRAAQDFVLQVLEARRQHQAWQHQQAMARLTRRLLADFAALKREHGWVDMNDVERAALVLLGDPVLGGWIQQRLDARVRHLLIDEFQDTNPLQWQALQSWLGSYAGAGAGAAPSLFIVGDPKQSIYRFRRAEPQVFRAAQAFIADGLGGELLSCDHTRRNAPAVIDAVNAVMLAAQQAGDYAGFRAHTTAAQATGEVVALAPVPRAAAAAGAPAAAAPDWRDTLTAAREPPEETLRQLECRQAARWLAAALRELPLRPGEVMVLARKRDRLRVMEEELRAVHIPALQPEKRELGEAAEVQDIVALVDALVSPSHDLSLARALKSPLFGATDDELAALARAARGDRSSLPAGAWFATLQAGQGLPARLRAAAAVLSRWQSWLGRLPPHDALDAIYHDGDVLARYARAAPPARRGAMLANLRATLASALQIDGGRYATPYAWVRALRRGGVRAPAAPQADAVQLLTIHGAKGLEAPLVLLLDTDAAPPRSETMGVLIDWPGEAALPQRFVFLASEARPPRCCAALLQAELASRRREELNALYVALTRAQSRIVVSAVEAYRPDPGSWWRRLLPHCALQPALAVADPGLPAGAAAPPLVELRALPAFGARTEGQSAAAEPDSPAARLGRAMHRLLQWQALEALTDAADRQAAVAREFALDAEQAAQAARMADRVRGGDGAWAWDWAVIDWADDEVALVHEGRWLRLDRLVRRRDTGHWWVLDYKSAGRPAAQGALRQQLEAYRAAVQAVHDQAVVRVAFLTAQGQLVEPQP